MGEPNGTLKLDTSGLRERLPQKPDTPIQAESAETAQDAVKQLNDQEQKGDKLEKDKKTYGRTLDGTGEYFAVLSTCRPGFHCSRSIASM